MMAVFIFPLWIFFAHHRPFWKGLRTGARDMLSDEATPQRKKIFGFHRSMDTLGAVLGPSLALLYLYFYPENYTTLFYIAFIPGLLLYTLLLKKKKERFQEKKATPFFSFWAIGVSPPMYHKVVIGLLAFTLFNSCFPAA
jgi:hypothetical protein